MCDELTEADNLAYLAAAQLSRRDATIGAGATLAVVFTGCTSSSAPLQEPQPTTVNAQPDATPASPKPSGQMVNIQTADGSAEGFFVAPEGGPHPGLSIGLILLAPTRNRQGVAGCPLVKLGC